MIGSDLSARNPQRRRPGRALAVLLLAPLPLLAGCGRGEAPPAGGPGEGQVEPAAPPESGGTGPPPAAAPATGAEPAPEASSRPIAGPSPSRPPARAGDAAASLPPPADAPGVPPQTRPEATAMPAPSPAAEPAPEPAGAPLPVVEPAAPALDLDLDLDALDERLRATPALGPFSKLKLKNQLDDLLDGLRRYHGGRPEPGLAQLRERYELLLMKLLAVLNEGDPALSRDIVASREPIWDLLADPVQFSQRVSDARM